MNFPRYFIGQYAHAAAMIAARKGQPAYEIARGIGRYAYWSPHWTPGDPNAPVTGPWLSSDSHLYIIMHDSTRIPHPEWVELPHLLSPTPVKKHLQTHTEPYVVAALADPVVKITGNDTMYSVAERLHAQMKVFL